MGEGRMSCQLFFIAMFSWWFAVTHAYQREMLLCSAISVKNKKVLGLER